MIDGAHLDSEGALGLYHIQAESIPTEKSFVGVADSQHQNVDLWDLYREYDCLVPQWVETVVVDDSGSQ